MADTADERLKTVARQLFLRSGFEETGIDLIAREARVSKQSMYELYPTKVDLFGAVMRDVIASISAEIPSELSIASGDPATVIGDVMKSYLAHFLSPENMGLTRAQLVATRCFPHLATELHNRTISGAPALAHYLASLMQDGILQEWDPAALARRFGSVATQGTRFLMGFPIHRPWQDGQARYSIDLLLNGYRRAAQFSDATLDAPLSEEPLFDEIQKKRRIAPERIEDLMDAASDEFLNQGFRGARIDHIVEKSGVGAATIYRQFGDKRGLFQQVLIHLGRPGDVTDAPRAESTVGATLQRLARWLLDRHLHPRNLLYQRLMICEAERYPDIARWAYDGQVASTASVLTQRLVEFGMPIPSLLASRTFYNLATFGVRFVVTTENPDSSQRAALSREATTLFLNGTRERSR